MTRRPILVAAGIQASLLLVVTLLLAPTSTSADTRDGHASTLGVTHIHGSYALTDQPFLIEGAQQARQLGFRILKLHLALPPAGNPVAESYPFHSQWPHVNSLVELCQTPYVAQVFREPFDTFILTVYAAGRYEHYWRKGVSDAQAEDETRQFQALTQHLLSTFQGTGKTFVLCHWEGDWALRGSFDAKADPTPTAIQGMIRWLNARQQGVTLARSKSQARKVQVLHATEVNRVRDAMEDNRPCVVNAVLPHTTVDLVSYSAWDTQSDTNLFRNALDYIASQAPDRPPYGNQNVFIGEFGLPENQHPQERVVSTIGGVVKTAQNWGCPYVVFWQLYCNEALHRPVKAPKDVRGFWLIRPDGTRSWAWKVLEPYLQPTER